MHRRAAARTGLRIEHAAPRADLTAAVAADEAQLAVDKQRLSQADTDGDGQVTRAEFAAYRAGRAVVIFLDLTMPGMDGYQVLETLRSRTAG